MATLPAGFQLEVKPQPSQVAKVKIPEGFTKERTFFDDITDAIKPIDRQLNKLPGSKLIAEALSAANRGVVNIAQSLVGDPINATLQLAGSGKQLPQFAELPLVKEATEGGSLDPGLLRDVVRAGGEVAAPGALIGGLVRGVAAQIPAQIAAKTKLGEFGATAAGAFKQLGAGTVVGDVSASALSGAGATAGEKAGGTTGAIVGGLLAPLSGVAIKGLADAGLSSVSKALTASSKGMSDEGAAKLFAEAMTREGIGPDEVVKRLQALGPEAIPADAGPVFARLLKSAADQVGRIQGRASSELGERQLGQPVRVSKAIDEATGTSGLSLQDEIVRIGDDLGPQIDDAYKLARQRGEIALNPPAPPRAGFLSPDTRPRTKMQALLEGDAVLGTKAKTQAQAEITAKKSAGEPVTSLDLIDASKRALDDEILAAIKKGENNKARLKIKNKNTLIREVDKILPEYKAARDLFAGKAALENASEQGKQFLKLNRRDIEGAVSSMSKSEKEFYKLGAKEAIFDKIGQLRTNANAVDRLFGKNDSVANLRSLFDTDKQLTNFIKAMEVESQFAKTKAAMGGSPSFKNFVDGRNAVETLEATGQAMADPIQAARIAGRIFKGLSKKKGTQENVDAFEAVGDILLTKGMSADRIRTLLQKGSAQQIADVFRKAIKADIRRPRAAAVATGITPTLQEIQ